MTQRLISCCAPVLLAFLSAACGGDDEDTEGTAGTGGQPPTAVASAGSGGNSGSAGSGGSSGSANGSTDSGGAGATQAGGGTGGAAAEGPSDQLVRDTSDICKYSSVLVEIDKGDDAAVEASIDSWIKTAVYDRSSGTAFILDTHDGQHLELSWHPPATKPAVVDFRGVLSYAAQDGSQRSLCFDGRMLDAYLYPVELYFPFVAAAAFEATPNGDCTTTAVPVTVSGCVSEGYNIR
jgi:hypothetical protein